MKARQDFRMDRIYRILTVPFQKHSPSFSELTEALGSAPNNPVNPVNPEILSSCGDQWGQSRLLPAPPPRAWESANGNGKSVRQSAPAASPRFIKSRESASPFPRFPIPDCRFPREGWLGGGSVDRSPCLTMGTALSWPSPSPPAHNVRRESSRCQSHAWHARLAHPQGAELGSPAWVRRRGVDRAGYAHHAARGRRHALSRAPPPRAAGVRARGVGAVREQPERQVLSPERDGPWASALGQFRVASIRRGGRTRAARHLAGAGLMTDESRPRRFRLDVGARRAERDVNEEIEFHIAMRAKKLAEAGLDPAFARVEAERQFGDSRNVRDECVTIDRARVRAVE